MSTVQDDGHSMENMVTEVTLHNNIEMSKICQKMSKIVQKLPKIAKKFTKIPKIVTSATMYIFHTVRYIARLTEKPIRSQKSQTSRGIQIEGI